MVPACFFYRWKKKISSEILLNHTGLRSIMSRVITLDCKQQGPYIAGQHAVIHCTVASVSRGILKPPSRSCSDTFTITHTHRARVAHLTQLFIQSGGPGLGCRVALRAEHLLVPVDEVAVAQSDHLHAARQTIERGLWFWL